MRYSLELWFEFFEVMLTGSLGCGAFWNRLIAVGLKNNIFVIGVNSA